MVGLRISSIYLLILVALIPVITPMVIHAEQALNIPRNETVIIGGGLWAPPTNFNPLVPWAATTGTIGLIYETLYLYIPNLGKWVPWLADGMPKWLNATALMIKLKDAKWWDGKPLTSEDVRFTFYELPKELKSLYYSSILNYLIDVKTPDARTVIFIFNKTTMNYPQFYYYLYTIPIVPKHIFEPVLKKVGNKILQLEVVGAKRPEDIVGSGMYRVYATSKNAVYFKRVDNWWGVKYFGKPGPKYIKYIMVFSNQVALAMLIRGDLDWSNFFIPGIPQLVKQYKFLVTFYRSSPYYLPANVVYLFINTHKPPLNDSRFRKALYYAIDIDRIVKEVYDNAVMKANPVGLIPIPAWKPFIAWDLIAKYGYKYDPAKAKKILDEAGYVDRNGDGWRDLPNGKTIELKILAPYGWTDWMQAAIIIADCLRKVGIKAEAVFPAYGVYADKMYKGEFDLLLNNFGSFVSISPYTLYSWLLYPNAPKIGQYSWSGNFGRYRNSNVTKLLDEIAHTPLNDTNKLKKLYRELEKILLDEMPYIPLWYNGYWFQATTLYWEGWPTEENPYAVPVTWPGRWQDGGLLVLLHLKPVKKTTPTITMTVVKTITTIIATTKTITTTTTTAMKTGSITKVISPTTISRSLITSVSRTISRGGANIMPYVIIAIIVVIAVIAAAIYLARRRS